MRIRIIQDILDILRGKNPQSNGSNNYLILQDKRNILLPNSFIPFKISLKGNNNRIILRGDYTLKHYRRNLKHLKIEVEGDNNLIDIEFPIKFDNVLIAIEGNNNTYKIEATKHSVRDARFYVENGSSIFIGKNSELTNRGLHVVVNNGYKTKPKLIIGDNVCIAKDAIIRTSDGHSLLDPISKKAINEPADVIIGNNVWITSRCTILKGAQIPDNSVVAACSMVNKKFTEPNIIIAGIPAKIIKRNICWDSRTYDEYMKFYERENNVATT